MAKTKLYECRNTGCPLGTAGQAGRFTGGASKDYVTMVTADPDPKHYGPGVCPNCAKPGVEVKD